jgi:hypothetical protein
MRHWWWLCLMPALCWAEPLKLAVPGLSTVDIDSQRTSFIAEHLAQELSDQGAQVVSAQDLTVMLGLERQRQLMGCTGGKCVTELTGTLGIDALVTGNVARVSGERYQLNLRMLDASSGQRVRTYTKRVVGFEALLDEMSKAAKILVVFGNKKFGRNSSPQTQTAVPSPRGETPAHQPTPGTGTEPPPPDTTPDEVDPAPAPAPGPPPAIVYVPRAYSQPSVVRQYAWVPMAAGGVCLGAGVFFLLGSDAKYQELTTDRDKPLEGAEAVKLRNQGQSQQNLARIGLSVGTTLLVTGAAMALFSSPGSLEPQVAIGPNQVSLGFAGDLPW